MSSIAPLTALEVVTWLAHASWQAAVLGLLVLFGSWTLRGRLEPRWRFGLWLIVLARLALLVTPPAPWSLFWLVPWSMSAAGTRSPADSPIAVPFQTNPQPASSDVEAHPGEVTTEVSFFPVTPSESDREEFSTTLPTTGQWLGVAWLAGVVLLLARHGWLHLRLRQQRRAWHEVADPVVREVFCGCRQELGAVRPVQLLVAAGRFGPATLGVFRAAIVLPERLLASLSPGELRLVLLHELTHVRRWDVLLDRVATLVVSLHWFNPVAWLALFCMRRERDGLVTLPFFAASARVKQVSTARRCSRSPSYYPPG